MSNKPIGIFDSGVGGTSIWKEIHALLPFENTIYLADSKNAPYGPKGKERIIELSIKNTEFLLERGCKIIVVACNTATTNAIKVLRESYDVPFIGIEPAIKPAALLSKTKVVGILATKGTLSSDLFNKTSDLFASGIEIIEQDGEGIVPLIEEGKLESEEMTDLLKLYLNPMINADIDYLVLGCSHYPYLIPELLKILPNDVKIIDSGEAVAIQTKEILKRNNLLNMQKTHVSNEFITNANPSILSNILGNECNVTVKDF
ncbi:MAG: glutamate racemase [Bacteroidia bacterium]|nr:glutamate racemase [Bacteroidia bacterium]MBT8309892.1 glutamate racemase [Bacteroidia bacterium]NND09814.1 glutamate racemase [Flavobacteriaceae bacterium]NNK29038.1 glutamate racemase [Flavobacteriaceae bacterium]NNL59767.1 glutamate racemase [Flavobacteriaceae bacterium]